MIRRRWTTFCIVCIGTCLALAVSLRPNSTVSAESALAPADEEIAKQEAAVASEALTLLNRTDEQSLTSVESREVTMWSRRLVEATRRSGASKEDLSEILSQHLARVNKQRELIQRLYKHGVASRLDVLDAEYEALDAKSLLESNELTR